MNPALETLRLSQVLSGLAEEHLAFLAERAEMRAVAAGETVFEQGKPLEGCYLLRSGNVVMSFRARQDEAGEAELSLREFSDPGRLLGWSGLLEPRQYRTTVRAVEPTSLVRLPARVLHQRMEARPDFAAALLERVIWVLGNRLRETRIRLVARRYATEVAAIRVLLDQSAEVLHVNSPLHKVPYYLENRLTLSDAFDALELVKAHGDRHERDLAALSLDLLGQVRKELVLYRDLQQVYETVTSAPPDTPPGTIRRRACEDFIKLFEKLDYVIRGEENLPDAPGHIFIMNHLVNHPDNTLPNHFQLTLDTHFVSSMLLLQKYGEAPIRVVRRSKSDEFGHQKYYDRLGYIYVGRADHSVGRAPPTMQEQRQAFLDEASAHLRAGRNLVICPEGTSVATPASPVGFKAGAFRLAANAEPEPLIVPIAVANFDKQITRTRLAVCVYEPFRLSHHLPRGASDEDFFDFVNALQRRFIGYVQEAVRHSQKNSA